MTKAVRKTKKKGVSKRTARFHIRKTFYEEFKPYLIAANGEYVSGSESYKRMSGAKKWIERTVVWISQASRQETIIDED